MTVIAVRIQPAEIFHSRRFHYSTTLAFLAGCLSVLLATSAGAAIQFQDVSAETNMTGHTESWGASVGDLNGDNCPDLFIQGHRDYPRFYRNTCDGSFDDIAYAMDPGNWIAKPQDDKHGASWADFDNDGDEDLLLTVSATGPGQLMVNENGTFVDRAVDADLSADYTARMGIWFDYTGDGYLDVAQTYLGNSLLRNQDPAQGLDFDNDKSGTGFTCPGRIDYGLLVDLNNDQRMEIICGDVSGFPNRVWDTATRPFVDITSSFPSTSLVSDAVLADFNNDQRYDIVLVRGLQRPSGAVQTSSRHIESWLRTSPASSPDKGFSFAATGEITVKVYGRYTGGGGVVANAPDVFMLDSGGTSTASSDQIHIDYQQNRWNITISNEDTEQNYVQVDTATDITGFQVTGLESAEGPTPLRHIVNTPTGLTTVFNTGLNNPISCVSAVAGDFNNDMWVDLYVVCRDGPTNIANMVYENQGDGTFQLVSNTGGEGPVGTGITEFGVGENAVVFDYDGDGFLDLSVLNGLLFYPVRIGGPDTLLRNTTNNGNHWLEFDLRGTVSNRDGVGANVFVTAGGVTQLREQNGGYHRSSQNHQRLHFGLGANQTASVRVVWPSGEETTLDNVDADHLYEIGEDGALSAQTFGPPIHTQLNPGDECGEPPYDLEYGPAVFVWRDCPGGTWHFRAKGGRENEMQLYTEGTITADAPFGNVNGYQLTGSDALALEDSDTKLGFSVNVWFTNDKGFDFDTGGQSSACFDLSRQDIASLIVGASGTRISASSFDLFSLGECDATPPPPDDTECGEPSYDRFSEPGLYAWRDCDFAGPAARWNFRAVAGGLSWNEYTGDITSDVTLSATAPGISGPDSVDSTPGDSTIDYGLWVGGGGQDNFQVDVPADSQTCFTSTMVPPGATVQVGADRQVMSGPFDLLTLDACDAAPPPPTDPACGEPGFNQQNEPGVYVWKDCEASGTDAEWHARFASGGTSWSSTEGMVTSDMPLSATGVGLSGPDEFDEVPGDDQVEFRFWSGGSGVDGFDMTVPDGAQTCFAVGQFKPGAQIELGADRQAMPSSFDLTTLGACN